MKELIAFGFAYGLGTGVGLSVVLLVVWAISRLGLKQETEEEG